MLTGMLYEKKCLRLTSVSTFNVGKFSHNFILLNSTPSSRKAKKRGVGRARLVSSNDTLVFLREVQGVPVDLVYRFFLNFLSKGLSPLVKSASCKRLTFVYEGETMQNAASWSDWTHAIIPNMNMNNEHRWPCSSLLVLRDWLDFQIFKIYHAKNGIDHILMVVGKKEMLV